LKRQDILDTAKNIITNDRAATHGGAEDSFGTIADMWSAYLGVNITQHDVCAMMVLLKVARVKGNAKHLDSWIDIAGYSAIGGEISGGD
jgi:hypothetical protein